MRRALVLAGLDMHEPADETEAEALRVVRAALSEGVAPLSRSSMNPGHITASAFVLSPDATSLLMIFHGKLARWLQPGGHVDPEDATLEDAARREVAEETGLTALDQCAGTPWALDVDVHDIPANPRRGEAAHQHLDVRFLFQARQWDVVAASDAQEVRWVPLGEVVTMQTDASVLRAVRKLTGLLGAAESPTPRHAPATTRNREAICDVLRSLVPPGADVLEVASGTGEHAAFLAERLEVSTWIPSDVSAEARASTRAHTATQQRVSQPLVLDVTADGWARQVGPVDVVWCANMVHIAPWEAAEGLLRGAGELLSPGGQLVLYGPFRAAGAHTAPSNASFDAMLKQQDASWGVRDLEAVVATAASEGLVWRRTVPMPANNHIVVFERAGRVDDAAIDEVLSYWFGTDAVPSEARQRAWWSHSVEADTEIRGRFGALHALASRGGLAAWEQTPRGRLALILVLDQFSRQIHRGGAGMFASDALALRVSREGARRGMHASLALHEQLFWWMPWMHAEELGTQHAAVAAFRALAERARAHGSDAYDTNVDFAVRHRDIIERFGRFPHRNALLGRTSSPEEVAFLQQPGSSF